MLLLPCARICPDRRLHFAHFRHAGGKQNGLLLACDMLQEGQVCDFAGWNLECRDTEFFEQIGAFFVERRRKKQEAGVLAIFDQST